MKMRCINLDWLEVYCLESSICDANYFRAQGYEVQSREYGTPLYEQMFVIFQEGVPYIEIRRAPHNPKGFHSGGILPANAAHIRFDNRSCYLPGCVNLLRSFLVAHGYMFVSISRVDICCDFNRFDNGMMPKNFINKWFKAEFSKLYQGRFSAHGADKWGYRDVNSVKWGRPTSAITTKLYNKSMEMREVKEKLYIKDAWLAAGLNLAEDVWRVEFSISSSVKVLRLRKPKNQEQVEETREQEQEINFRTLNRFDTPFRLIDTFAALCSHYFKFKAVERTESGALREKRYCRTIKLFNFVPNDVNYVVKKVTLNRALNRTERILVGKLKEIMKDATVGYRQREIIWELLNYLSRNRGLDTRELPSKEDALAIRDLQLTNEYVAQRYWYNSEERQRAEFIDSLEATPSVDLIDDILTTLPDAPF